MPSNGVVDLSGTRVALSFVATMLPHRFPRAHTYCGTCEAGPHIAAWFAMFLFRIDLARMPGALVCALLVLACPGGGRVDGA